ncbi:helix-turn-helix domain-containing protein [Streptomyces sp. NPDC057287]|uniref:helix-turn-helix domain-containing protein n=1 Tax=Streptomyces sp. NPDC057287 TaxID=3346086 RepID=UPI003633B2E3
MQNSPGQPGSLGNLPGPVHQLASALSHLHRRSGKNLRELAQEVGVSRPYISRVLAGARVPSWSVTRRLAVACSGDPADLRALWETARGIRMPADLASTDAAFTLRAALRGLYLSAAQPTAARIGLSSLGMLDQQDIDSLIRGSSLPDWVTVKRFVSMLRGRPADIRPLWDAARAAAKPVALQVHATQASPLQAAAFG